MFFEVSVGASPVRMIGHLPTTLMLGGVDGGALRKVGCWVNRDIRCREGEVDAGG